MARGLDRTLSSSLAGFKGQPCLLGGHPIVLLGRGPVITVTMEKGQDVHCGVKFHIRRARREDSHSNAEKEKLMQERGHISDLVEPKAV